MSRESVVKLRVSGIATEFVEKVRAGGIDANGQPVLRRRAEGVANPCRHCLEMIAEGEDKLVLSYRPFAALQPYAETGPIFLHASGCSRYDSNSLPIWFRYLDPAIVRGYNSDDWIVYETGSVVPGKELERVCSAILAREDVAYVHVRSKFNCFQCRVDRG